MTNLKVVDVNNWVRNQFEVDPTGLALRNLFMDAYYSPDPQIWVSDGQNSRSKRKEIFPEYKEGRKRATDNFYETLKIFKGLLLLTNKISIEIPGWEADDIIAQIAKENNDPEVKITIFSTDKDFAALVRPGFVETNREGIKGVDPKDIRLYKTLVGDTSDNVKGIKGFGKKAWESLTSEQKEGWVQLLNGDNQRDPLLLLGCYQATWVKDNLSLLQAYWKVVGFIPVPKHLVQQHMKLGTPNLDEANRILKGLFQ